MCRFAAACRKWLASPAVEGEPPVVGRVPRGGARIVKAMVPVSLLIRAQSTAKKVEGIALVVGWQELRAQRQCARRTEGHGVGSLFLETAGGGCSRGLSCSRCEVISLARESHPLRLA